MIRLEWKDCRLTAEGTQVVLENAALRTCWRLEPEGLALACVENRLTGFCWQSADGAALAPACMAPPDGEPEWEARPQAAGLCAEHWSVRCTWRQGARSVSRCFLLYPQTPFLTMWAEWEAPPEGVFAAVRQTVPGATGVERDSARAAAHSVPGDVMAAVPLPRGHLRWRCIRLADQTDVHDTLVWEQGAPVYPAERVEASGSFFTVEDTRTGETLLAARHAPITPAPGPQFLLAENCLCVLQNGCAGAPPAGTVGCTCVLGTAPAERLWEQYRAFYRLGWQAPWQRHALLLSNTWGDRNRDARVCETFVLQEIDRAAALGLDTVQIDDGWQKGTTVNSARPLGGVWEGYYAADADFWTPHPERFPRGLYPVAEHAAACGVALGLWFSPDSSGEFANWRRDAETLLRLWRTYGVAVFKLDGVKLRTPAARAKYLSLLEMVTAQSGRRVMLQQDITAEQRMGYLAAREYGTLFVENRYTDFGNYYPHRTLRNLWMLARYVPAQRMLFELLNPARNTERYRADPLAPGRYTADYLFASVMAAQPLLWMELSGLGRQDAARLQQIIGVYRLHREAMWACDVRPVGQEPDGRSFTGFAFTSPCGQKGYLLLFRENVPESAFTFTRMPQKARLRLLCANGPVGQGYTPAGDLCLRFAAPRTMRFISGRHKAPAKEAHKKRQGMHALPFLAEREEPVSLRCPRGAPPRAKCRTCGGKPYKTCFAWKNRIVRKFRLYPAQSRAEAPLHGRAAIPPHTR